MTAVGGVLGWKAAVVVALFLAPIVGTFVGIFHLIFAKDHYFAYGPFLALGTIVFMVWGTRMLDSAGATLQVLLRAMPG